MAQVALVEVFEAHADPFRRDELTRWLRRELSERGVVADFVSLLPPPGGPAGAAAPMASGALAVSLFSGPSVAALAEGVFCWLAAGEGRGVRVTAGGEGIELDGCGAEQRRLLVGWLLRHSGAADREEAGDAQDPVP